jgi:flagellar biosynthesis/type III secretory pathway protein FliH
MDEADHHDYDELSSEWQSRQATFSNVGYRDGLEEGKQEAVQEGFDAGKCCARWAVCTPAGRP